MAPINQMILCFLSFLCLPFYVIFILTIIRLIRTPQKYLKYLSFYHLILSCSAADLWYVLNYYLFYRFLKWEWLPYNLGGDWFSRYSLSAEWYLKYSQAIGVLIIGINRFYAVVRPVKYHQVGTFSFAQNYAKLSYYSQDI